MNLLQQARSTRATVASLVLVAALAWLADGFPFWVWIIFALALALAITNDILRARTGKR